MGDVHGRADLLAPMLRWIREDSWSRSGEPQVHLVFLGDLIDRGPASAAVIDLVTGEDAAFARRHFLRGNHEQTLLDVIDGDASALDAWLSFGGEATLDSYGIDSSLQWRDPEGLRRRMIESIPPAHLAFLRQTEPCVRIGDYLFVHAGIRPGVPLEQQNTQDMYWIRGAFLRSRVDHGVMVVHGHTVASTVQIKPNRIGIDTGAYASGRLTVLGLERARRWLLVSRLDPA